MSGRTVLVVDDDEDIVDAVRMILTRHGWDVAVAYDGAHALERLQQQPRPDLVLLDLMMPGLDGGQLREAMRADERLARVPVVVLSGAGDVAERAAQVGAVDWLRKPFELSELLDVARRYAPGDERAGQ